MEIIVNEKYKIITQEYGFDLVEIVQREKKIKEKGKAAIVCKGSGEFYESETTLGYYTNFKALISKLVKLHLHEKKTVATLQQFLEEFKQVEQEILPQLKEIA